MTERQPSSVCPNCGGAVALLTQGAGTGDTTWQRQVCLYCNWENVLCDP